MSVCLSLLPFLNRLSQGESENWETGRASKNKKNVSSEQIARVSPIIGVRDGKLINALKLASRERDGGGGGGD